MKQYCRKERKARQKQATMRVTHTPGLAGQVDWKEDMTLISRHGEIFRFNIFLYVLSFSRKKYITLTFDRHQDNLEPPINIRCIIQVININLVNDV